MTPTLPSSAGTASPTRIWDPDFHAHDAAAAMAALRADDPVHWIEPIHTWVLSRHADVKRASRDNEHFSVSAGVQVPDPERGTVTSSARMWPENGEFLALTDPPRHTELRRVLAPSFTARAVAAREDRVRRWVGELVDRFLAVPSIEAVDALSTMPVKVMLDLLGLPVDEAAEVRRLGAPLDRLNTPQTPEGMEQTAVEFARLTDYVVAKVAERRRSPAGGDDVLSVLLDQQARGDGAVTEANLLTFLLMMLAAGNDTTRSLLVGTVVTMASRPEAFAAVRRDPDGRSRNAVEELQRWITPARGFLRTVVAPIELHGRSLEPGHRVYLSYESANHDDAVFADPDRFDVERTEAPQQLAFGFGTHVCIGAAYARMQGRLLLEELARRVDRIELVAEPVRVRAVLRNGWSHAEVRVVAEGSS